MLASRLLAATIILPIISGCFVATSYTDRSYPTATGHAREEIDTRTGTIRLYFEHFSVDVRLREEVPSTTETLWIGVVPVPQTTGETETLRAQRNARIRFWVSVMAVGGGVAYAPMKTTLRKGEAEPLFPIGYVREYDFAYSDILPLTSSRGSVPCSLNTEFNVIYEATYDPRATYLLSIEGLSEDGTQIHVPPITFLPKRVSRVRS